MASLLLNQHCIDGSVITVEGLSCDGKPILEVQRVQQLQKAVRVSNFPFGFSEVSGVSCSSFQLRRCPHSIRSCFLYLFLSVD